MTQGAPVATRDREQDRLAALARYDILDTPREADFDDIAALASEICDTPIAVVNLIDAHRQWFKAEVGLGVRETPLETSFCAHAILEQEFMLVPDAAQDPRFACNPLVTADNGLRFYAGALLRTPDGQAIGTLCVLDTAPRDLTAQQVRALQRLARQVMTLLALRLALAEQRESSHRLRRLADAAPVMMWMSEPDGRCSYLNQAWCSFTGQAEEAALGFGWLAEIHPDERAVVEQSFLAANATAVPFRSEYRLRDAGGVHRWVLAFATPRFDAAGAFEGFIGSVVDIDERRKAEEALRASETYLRLLLDSTSEGFYSVDRDGSTTLCNAAFLRMLGFGSAEEVVGRKLHGLIHHSHPDGSHYDVGDCPIYVGAQTGAVAHVTGELFFRSDGTPLPVDYRVHPIIVDGVQQGAICTFTDVSERVAAEAASRASEQRYSALFNSLDAGFCVIELKFAPDGKPIDYRFVEVNEAFVRQTGLTDAAGRWMRTLAPNHEQHWFDAYGKVATTGESVRFEDAAEALDRRWYDVHAFRIGAPGAHQVAVLFNDITERRRSELALQQLNRTLDARVAEAVAAREAAMDALRQSQKLEAIGQLTGGVAHDFNNLLTVIRGSTDLLKRPGLSDARRERYVAAIADTADRATALTGQLLAFARRQTLKPKRFDVGASVQGVAEMIGTLVGARVEIAITLPDTPCFIDADPSQFDTAIVNMAVNARDAMDNAGRLEIAIAPVEQMPGIRTHAPIAGAYVAVSVSDTGAGIAPDVLERIFEPFFTTKEVGQGTGLGLSQVFGFAKQSGGEVAVASEVGGGTVFTLYLPRATREPMPEIAVEPVAMANDGAGTCVLVVEDNAAVGTFVTTSLADMGFDTVLASDAAAALAELARDADRFQIVFSDVVMPGMNGLDLAREIGRRHPGLPVVLTSGYSDVLVRDGSDGFEIVGKPYALDDLQRTLNARARQRSTRLA